MQIRIRIILLAAVHNVTALRSSSIELSYLLSYIWSHQYIFKNVRFHFAENGIKILRPHDRFLIVLSASAKMMKATGHGHVFNTLLHMCIRRYLNFKLNIQLAIHNQASYRSEIPLKTTTPSPKNVVTFFVSGAKSSSNTLNWVRMRRVIVQFWQEKIETFSWFSLLIFVSFLCFFRLFVVLQLPIRACRAVLLKVTLAI